MSKNEKKVRIFSALEVANICGVVNQTAINWIKNQHLKAFTTPGGQYRVYGEDLFNFLEERNMRIPDELVNMLEDQQRLKVLIIDDEVELNNMIQGFITRKIENCEISQAFDGFEAGKLLFETKPNLIILDIGLPGINGFKLCKTIRQETIFDKAHIISLSGLNNPLDAERIIKEGANSFFAKPLDFGLLMSDIEAFAKTI